VYLFVWRSGGQEAPVRLPPKVSSFTPPAAFGVFHPCWRPLAMGFPRVAAPPSFEITALAARIRHALLSCLAYAGLLIALWGENCRSCRCTPGCLTPTGEGTAPVQHVLLCRPSV